MPFGLQNLVHAFISSFLSSTPTLFYRLAPDFLSLRALFCFVCRLQAYFKKTPSNLPQPGGPVPNDLLQRTELPIQLNFITFFDYNFEVIDVAKTSDEAQKKCQSILYAGGWRIFFGWDFCSNSIKRGKPLFIPSMKMYGKKLIFKNLIFFVTVFSFCFHDERQTFGGDGKVCYTKFRFFSSELEINHRVTGIPKGLATASHVVPVTKQWPLCYTIILFSTSLQSYNLLQSTF